MQQAFNNADQLCWTASATGTCTVPPTGATTYRYDTRGNRTQVTPPAGGATSLTYDQANRLTGYGVSFTYAYNGDGLRMSKTGNGMTTQELWDPSGSLPLLLKDGSTSYVVGPGGQPLEQINGSNVIWLHNDQVGSIRLVTGPTGSSVGTYAFDPYGKLTASTGTITNPFRFAGQYVDSESGLYYMRARNYDPGTGQFLTRDPLLIVTMSPYAYGGGSPLNIRDPLGLDGRIGENGEVPPSVYEIIKQYRPLSPDEEARYQRYLKGYQVQVPPEEITCPRFVTTEAAEREVTSGYRSTSASIPSGAMSPPQAFRAIGRREGIDVGRLSKSFHRIKKGYGLPPNANRKVDPEGNVYSVDTGEQIGNILDDAAG